MIGDDSEVVTVSSMSATAARKAHQRQKDVLKNQNVELTEQLKQVTQERNALVLAQVALKTRFDSLYDLTST
jgi:hypothetical protein